jgi:hypothetical protein
MSLEGKSAEVIQGLAAFSDKLLSGPARMDALRLAKKVDPNFKHAELEIADQIAASETVSEKRIDALEKQLVSEKMDRARADKERELKAQGFDIVAVEKCMTDNHISDYDAAVRYMKGERAMAPAAPYSRTTTQMPVDFKEIAKNPDKWGKEMANKVVNEIIAARPAA